MKKQWKLIYFGIAISILIITLFSCSPPNSNSTDTKNHATQPGQNEPPAPTELQTVEPGAGNFDLEPVAGSVLRWVDLSDFVYVPADEFIMGADSLIFTDFRPAHVIGMGGFWIQQAEVTNQQYALCVAAGICSAPFVEDDIEYWYANPNNANKPVVGVSWYQAQEYCTYIEARLPTEAEWEMTARGTEGKNYPWGDDEPICDLLNFDDCLDPSEPEDVKKYNNGTSPFEAMDMSGNVNEWVADWYQEDYYPESPNFNPPGPLESELITEEKEKVFRGGGYATSLEKISPILRFKSKPEEHAADLGFRCVLLGEGGEITVPAPACQVAALNIPQDSGPTMTPFAVLPPDIFGYCYKDLNGNNIIGVHIENVHYPCFTGYMTDFSINIPNDKWAITCKLKLGVDCSGDYFNCTSPHFVEGVFIGINYCYEDFPDDYSQLNPECTDGFAYNIETGWCEPVNSWLPEPPCPDGYYEFEGGCLPIKKAFDGCPVGYYSYLAASEILDFTYICIPLDICLLPNAPESCESAPICPSGQSYDENNQCCLAPEPLKAMCPTGWYFDKDSKMCGYPTLMIADCESASVKIPTCLAPTPTLTPTEKLNCSSFLDELSCKNSGCDWVQGPTGGFVCKDK